MSFYGCFSILENISVENSEIQNNKEPVLQSCLRVTNEYSKLLQSDICSRLSKYFYFRADKLEAHLVILTLTLCVSLLEL